MEALGALTPEPFVIATYPPWTRRSGRCFLWHARSSQGGGLAFKGDPLFRAVMRGIFQANWGAITPRKLVKRMTNAPPKVGGFQIGPRCLNWLSDSSFMTWSSPMP